MLYDASRQRPTPGATSSCPACKTKLLAKCGTVNIWHWAHESLIDCDPWYEGISAWHLNWQALVKEPCREVVMGPHRADIRLSDGRVIEIQHSLLSPEEVQDRELFYDQLTWIIDAKEFEHNLVLKPKVSKAGNPYWTFRWKRPRKGFLAITKFPLYFDFQNGSLLQVNGWNSYSNTGQWGEHTTWYGWGWTRLKASDLFIELFGDDYDVHPTHPLLNTP